MNAGGGRVVAVGEHVVAEIKAAVSTVRTYTRLRRALRIRRKQNQKSVSDVLSRPSKSGPIDHRQRADRVQSSGRATIRGTVDGSHANRKLDWKGMAGVRNKTIGLQK